MSEHIPGTWEDAVDLWDENGMILAKVLKRGDVKKRYAMLDAAPDMLSALKLAHKLTFKFEELYIYDAIKEVIAKAEGK